MNKNLDLTKLHYVYCYSGCGLLTKEQGDGMYPDPEKYSDCRQKQHYLTQGDWDRRNEKEE